MKRKAWLGLAIAALLVGCSQTAVREGNNEVPVSQQPAATEAQKRAKVHTDLGLAYYDSRRMAIALEEARRAIDADPGYGPAYNLLGLVHMYLMENGPADDAFRKAVSLAPSDPEINNNYGWFLCTLGREKEGIERLMSAVKNPLYTTPTKPFTNAGLCSLRLKDETAAAEYFRRAVEADPRNAQALYHLANHSYGLGNYQEAQRLIGAVLEIQEANAASLWLALRVERKLGDQAAESKFANQLRQGFAGSKEHQMLIRGQYE